MKTWTLSLVLLVTAWCGLSNAKADDDRDYWRYRHDRYSEREDWRYRRHRDRWREREARRDYWRHRHHRHHYDNGVVIRLP